MTRINAGIPVDQLSDKHLIAEHREIKRIPNMIFSGRAKLVGIPENFILGKGHVKFFYNKLLYLKLRYEELYEECKRRGFNITYFGDAWKDSKPELMNDWKPTKDSIKLIKQRIKERS